MQFEHSGFPDLYHCEAQDLIQFYPQFFTRDAFAGNLLVAISRHEANCLLFVYPCEHLDLFILLKYISHIVSMELNHSQGPWYAVILTVWWQIHKLEIILHSYHEKGFLEKQLEESQSNHTVLWRWER